MKVPDFVHCNIAPVFSVFNDDLTIDDTGQRNMLDFLYRTEAISAYFVRSGLGQLFTYQFDDVKKMAEIACKHLADKAPVLVCCNGVWDRDVKNLPNPELYLQQARDLSRYAQEVGAAGVVHTLPEMITPRHNETIHDVIRRYFEMISQSVSLPIFIYQPPQTDEKYRLTPSLVLELADIDNIVGTKISTNDAYYLFSLIRATKDKEFAVITGAETMYYAGLYAGSRAVIGQGCSINPQIIKTLHQRFEAGDADGVLCAQDSVNLLVDRCRNAVDFLKCYANEQGFTMGRAYRQMANNPYMKFPEALSQDEYAVFKVLYETELMKYNEL